MFLTVENKIQGVSSDFNIPESAFTWNTKSFKPFHVTLTSHHYLALPPTSLFVFPSNAEMHSFSFILHDI